jgi:tetratricopeptide (TPR) repeat protein
VAAIVARADGIPLYAVETVRMLLAEGRLTEKDGAYAPVGDLAELAVPQTLTALVAARLDGLAPADRSLVHDAAVLGQSFTTNGLAAVSGMATADLEPRLTALVRQELLSRETDPRSPERGQYAFVQALIREVAYNTLAKPDRKARHLAAARYFESLGSDELAGALAGHYLAAHANAAAGPEADALAAQARIALRAAADRAVALGAHDQAVAFLDQAITVTTDPAERGDILERAASSATTAGHYGRAEALCRQAIDLYRGLGDRVGATRATTALGSALLHNAQKEAAIELLQAASAEFADLAPDPIVVSLDGMLLNALGFGERFPEALQVAERVLEAAEHRGLTDVLADALLAKGGTLATLGRVREGIGIIKAGEDLARDAGLTASHLRGIIARTFFELEIDNLRALAGMREGLELARRTGERGIMLRFANNVGFTAYLSGEWDEAIATLEGPLAEDLEPNHRVGLLGNALVVRASRGESISDGLAELNRLVSGIDEADSAVLKVSVFDAKGSEAFAAGRFGDARAAWLRVVEFDTTQGPPYYYQAARAALWGRELDAARSDLQALDETGVHGGVIEIRRATIRAGLAALEGRPQEAAVAYRQAIRDFDDQHLAFDAALTALDMTAFVGMSEPEVGPIAAAARAFFARVGAAPFVERLDAALGAAGIVVPATDGMPINGADLRETTDAAAPVSALPAE